MTIKPSAPLALAAAPIVAFDIARSHSRRGASQHAVEGGMLVPNALFYDRMARLLLGPLFKGIADDIADTSSGESRILEVGCGPGHLAVRLSRRGFDVTGIDLDPAMIKRARHDGAFVDEAGYPRLDFQVADVARMPFPDGAFDIVVSTLSMHHWNDPSAGLAEIDRVLSNDGRVLIWDIRPGIRHAEAPDPGEHIHGSQLRVASSVRWRWPGWFSPLLRTELTRTSPTSP